MSWSLLGMKKKLMCKESFSVTRLMLYSFQIQSHEGATLFYPKLLSQSPEPDLENRASFTTTSHNVMLQ
jgi:hypothetical protein